MAAKQWNKITSWKGAVEETGLKVKRFSLVRKSEMDSKVLHLR